MTGLEKTLLVALQKWHDFAFKEKMQPTIYTYPPLTGPTRNDHLFEQYGCSNFLTNERPTTGISPKVVTNHTSEDRYGTDPSSIMIDASVVLTGRYTFETAPDLTRNQVNGTVERDEEKVDINSDRMKRRRLVMDTKVMSANELLTKMQYTLQDTSKGCPQRIPNTIDGLCDSTSEGSPATPARNIIDAADSLLPFHRPISTQITVSRFRLKLRENLVFVKKRLKDIYRTTIEDGVKGEFGISYSVIQTAYVWLLVVSVNTKRNNNVCIITRRYRWTATASSSPSISDGSFGLANRLEAGGHHERIWGCSDNKHPSIVFVEESFYRNFSDTDGANQNSHKDHLRPINITYHIQNCQSVSINSNNSKGNKFQNSGNNAPKIINHGGLIIEPNISSDDSSSSTTDEDEDTERPYTLRSESWPVGGFHLKPIVVPLDACYQQWTGLSHMSSPCMGQLEYVYPQFGFLGCPPSVTPRFPASPLPKGAQLQNQPMAVPPGHTPPPMSEPTRSKNTHPVTQPYPPGMASGASPSLPGNTFQNVPTNPQQYPRSPFSSFQVQHIPTGVQNNTFSDSVPNVCTENNVFSTNASHHANKSPHYILPQSDPLRDTGQDKVKRLEHLLESALETAALIQADETIPDVLSARSHAALKSLQSLLRLPVRKHLHSRSKPTQRQMLNWSRVQYEYNRLQEGKLQRSL